MDFSRFSRDKERHATEKSQFIKRHTILKVYAPNNRVPKYTDPKLSELNRATNKSKIIVRNFNNPSSLMDKTRRQQLRKDLEELNTTNNELNLTDIYKTRSS